MIIAFVLTGKLLEERAKNNTSSAIKGLMGLQPKTAALVQEDGTEKEISVSELTVGDSVRVHPGERIPVDGIVASGESYEMCIRDRGIRAALCWTEELGRLARQHNDANVLVMPGRFISDEEAEKIVNVFLNTGFEGGRHQRRIDKIPAK